MNVKIIIIHTPYIIIIMFRCFFRKSRTSTNDEYNSGESIIIPIRKDGKNRVLLLFGIIRRNNRSSFPKINWQHQPASRSDNGGTTRSTNASSPSSNNTSTPISFIHFVDTEDENYIADMNNLVMKNSTSFIKLTQTNDLMERYGLKSDDSILSYMKEVDTVLHKNTFTQPDHWNVNDDDRDDTIDTDDYYQDDKFYTMEDINQGISVITMDTALLYSHSIVIDEYDWKSFISEHQEDYLSIYDKYDETVHTNPLRYYEI